ncbi:MAG: hypothetical protein SO170_02035 [Butyribacter sp.]|nr:hypothetical protein [Butyribacter sp.]
MGTLYLHIGTPKTGTSAIQVFMGKNRHILKKKGVCYPDFRLEFPGIGANRNAHFLVHRYFDKNKKRDYEAEKSIQEKAFSLLLENLSRYDKVVMSDEGIWNGFEFFEDFWKKLYQKITDAGHELKVIVYLRRQDVFIQSYWAQQVKETSTMTFQQFIEKKRYEKCHLDYDVSLEQIANVIGNNNMIVRVYEKGQYYGNSLVSDFLHIIGLEMDDSFCAPDIMVNQSISGISLEIKRILNTMPEYKEKRNFLVDYLRKLSSQENKASDFSRTATFLPEQQQSFMAQYEKGNELVAKQYLKKADGILFEEKVENIEGSTQEYTKEELVKACGQLMLFMEKQLEKEKKKNTFFKKTKRKIRKIRKL